MSVTEKKRTLVDVWQNTTLGDGDVTQKLVQLLIVADGELEMTWDDTGLLVVTSGVTGQLEDFGSEVLKNSGEVDWGTLKTVSTRIKRVKTRHLPAPTR
jgi:hypothetical protein